MASKKTKTTLFVAGATAAASALAFYFAWKAFRAYHDLHTDDEQDPEKDGQDLENLMKTSEEKRGSKIAEEEEEESGFKLEEFDQFIAEEYGEVLADCGKLENGFKASEIHVEGEFDRFGGYGIASGRGEDTQKKNRNFCSNEGNGGSEGFVGEFSSLSRDVSFDEMSMQDMAEEDGIIIGNAHQASESQRELGGQSAADFEFEVDDLEKSSDGQSSLDEEADVSEIISKYLLRNMSSDGSQIETSKPSDKLLNDLSEDSKKPDMQVSQQSKFDNNHNGPEDSVLDSYETRPKSSSGMDCNTLSSQAYEEALNTSDIATIEHSALQTGEDLGKQLNGETYLVQETNKSTRAGNDKASELLLEGPRASNLESSMHGGSNKHSEGLHAYDAYLADPSLSPSMRSQVARAKAIAQKLYAAKEGN